MAVTARTRYLWISPQKLRLAADLVRRQRALDALDSLRFTNKKAADMVAATLKSALANAENNARLNAASLVISEIRVDQGPRLRRYRPRSRGMANTVFHPMAHLTVTLDEAPAAAAQSKASAKQSAAADTPKAAATDATPKATKATATTPASAAKTATNSATTKQETK